MHSPLKYAPKAHSTVKVSIILFFCPSANVQSSATRNQPARTAPQSGTGSAIPRWLQRFVGHHVVNHSKLSSKSAPKNAGNTAHKSNDIFGPITGMKKQQIHDHELPRTKVTMIVIPIGVLL